MGSRAKGDLIGHIASSPQCDEYQPGKFRAKFTVAVNRHVKGEKVADFFRCVAFGKLAEMARDHLSKGRLISVDCEPQQYRWEEDDGTKRENVSFFVQRLTFLDKKTDGATPSGPSEAYSDSAGPYEPGGDEPPF